MNAPELTKALGGRWRGNYGEARCPAHEDRNPSLSMSQGQDDRVLTHCHAGCEPEAVWAAILRSCPNETPTRGEDVRNPHRDEPFPDAAERSEAAWRIWRASKPITGTLAETYLLHRGLTTVSSPALRYHGALKHPDIGQHLPALIAAVSGPDRKVTANQRTWLRLDGRGKAACNRPKMALGPLHDGAVHLAPAGPVLGLAEGVEDALAAMQLFSVPVWAALGTRFDKMAIPPEVRELHLYGDNGAPGREAAEKAGAVFREAGRRVVLRFPPAGFGDWNDALRAQVAA